MTTTARRERLDEPTGQTPPRHFEAVQGRTDKVITVDEQALAARERVLVPYHPGTLQSHNNLADAYQDTGRTDEERKLNP